MRRPLFLARSGYRRRRLNDAARLVPVFGAFLILLPILWAPAQTAERDTASDGIYLFVVWAALIGVAACLAPGLRGAGGVEADPRDQRTAPRSTRGPDDPTGGTRHSLTEAAAGGPTRPRATGRD